jgi:Homeodomain-like domain
MDDSIEMVQRAGRVLKDARSALELRAAQSVLFLDEYGLSLRQTAAMLGCSVPTVSRLRRSFRTCPPLDDPLKQANWGGRRRQNFSLNDERRLLYSLAPQGRHAEGIPIGLIRRAYETKLGRSVSNSTVLRLLRRHGWYSASRGSYQSRATAKRPGLNP